MEILRRVPDSVLWLHAGQRAQGNLRAAAEVLRARTLLLSFPHVSLRFVA